MQILRADFWIDFNWKAHGNNFFNKNFRMSRTCPPDRRVECVPFKIDHPVQNTGLTRVEKESELNGGSKFVMANLVPSYSNHLFQ